MKLKLFIPVFILVLAAACSQSGQKAKETSSKIAVQPVEVVYHVEGMTCHDCEQSIKKGVSEIAGVSLIEANYVDSTAKVVYDPSKTNETAIIAAIEKRGYLVIQPN